MEGAQTVFANVQSASPWEIRETPATPGFRSRIRPVLKCISTRLEDVDLRVNASLPLGRTIHRRCRRAEDEEGRDAERITGGGGRRRARKHHLEPGRI